MNLSAFDVAVASASNGAMPIDGMMRARRGWRRPESCPGFPGPSVPASMERSRAINKRDAEGKSTGALLVLAAAGVVVRAPNASVHLAAMVARSASWTGCSPVTTEARAAGARPFVAFRFHRPVRYRVALAIAARHAPGAERNRTVHALDRARCPPVASSQADVRGQPIQHRFMCRPLLRRRSTLALCVGPRLE
jgi:hypothetical protein